MIKNFISKLQPINEDEVDEWKCVISEFKDEFAAKTPNLFWYLSSGFDTKALVHFNEKDTAEVYHTPTVDIFVYSDYGSTLSTLHEYYEKLDNGSICLHKDRDKLTSISERLRIINEYFGQNEHQSPQDYRTYVTLDQMIPLRFFSQEDCQKIKEKYKDTVKRNGAIAGDGIFYYCLVNISSKYFGDEYFPILFIPMDNWVLLEEIWKPFNIKFDYVCGVCDGCRKGGAYKCVNKFFSDFFPVMKKESFWVSDHLYPKPSNFHQVACLSGWGAYHEKRLSFLYRIEQ